jgi:hypothetical protein
MMKPRKNHTTLLKNILSRVRCQPRGQSFVELIFVMMFLALLLAGMVEFGFLLNNYLHVLDGSREAARIASTSAPFTTYNGQLISPNDYNPPFYYTTVAKAAQTMIPVALNPANPDDIVISVFSMDGNVPLRWPATALDQNGWSLCAHYNANTDDSAINFPVITPPSTCSGSPYGGFAAYFGCISAPVPIIMTGCTARQSQFSPTDITNKLNGLIPTNSGVVLVEIFYNYPQVLKLPVFTNVLPDPISLYVYSLMPVSAAEPTQNPNTP